MVYEKLESMSLSPETWAELPPFISNAGLSVGMLLEKEEENSPSIRHQNQAVFEMFLGLSDAEKPDEETVLGV